MREIKKLSEPPELIAYRQLPNAQYDGDPSFTPVKDKISQQLLTEQGYLCAYCMQRISPSAMKVEHWHCQDKYPEEQLNYKNLLGACLGNEGAPPKDQTCDTHKANRDLLYNPANTGHKVNQRIRYLANGVIDADEPILKQQLGTTIAKERGVLNLNQSRLVQNRKAVIDAISETLARRVGSRKKGEIQRLLNHWLTPDSGGMLKPYYGVAVYRLEKKLKQL